MKANLTQLFEYQRFAENPELQRMIQSTQDRYMKKRQVLDDDEVEMVAAAGMAAGRQASPERMPWEKDVEKFFSEE